MVAEYTCVATAGDETATATTEVVTEEDDECQELMKVKTWSPTVMVEEGRDVTLPCQHQLGGFYLPSYWSISGDSSSIPDSDKHYTTHSGDLVVREVTWDDMGLYSCYGEEAHKINTFLYPLAKE